MFSIATAAALLPFLSLVAATPVPGTVNDVPSGPESKATADNSDLVAKLLSAPTAVDRYALLSNSDFVFDFAKPVPTDATTSGNGGHTVKADRKGFPALVGTGVSMTLGFLGPCGFNTPHVHPRSSEINVVVQGALVAEMIPENGAKLVRNRLDTWQMSVFPRGAVHTEFNPTCGNATFVAGFADEDPGVQQSAQTFLGLDDEIVAATLREGGSFRGQDIDAVRSLLPHNVAMGVQQCLQMCGIKPSPVAANATSSGLPMPTKA